MSGENRRTRRDTHSTRRTTGHVSAKDTAPSGRRHTGVTVSGASREDYSRRSWEVRGPDSGSGLGAGPGTPEDQTGL